MPPNNLQVSGPQGRALEGAGDRDPRAPIPWVGWEGMDGDDSWGAKIHLRFYAGFISPCPRPPLTDSLSTAALLGLEMFWLQQGGGMEEVGNSSISQLSVECQPHCSPSPKKGEGLHVERSFAPYPRSIQLLFFPFIFMLCTSMNHKPTHLLAAAVKVGVFLGNLIRFRGENPFLMSQLSNELD